MQVNFLNGLPDYVTTSSCSGRVALFQDINDTVCKKVRNDAGSVYYAHRMRPRASYHVTHRCGSLMHVTALRGVL
jgi:tRNA(Phe) wybutosine-synthesizing methylase Tyw3